MKDEEMEEGDDPETGEWWTLLLFVHITLQLCNEKSPEEWTCSRSKSNSGAGGAMLHK